LKGRNPLLRLSSGFVRKVSPAELAELDRLRQALAEHERADSVSARIEALNGYVEVSQHTPRQKLANLKALLRKEPKGSKFRAAIEKAIAKLS
jgi:hypothetical protein